MGCEESVGVTARDSVLAVAGAEVAMGVTVASPQAERMKETRRRTERNFFINLIIQSNPVVE
jgi:nickel-dependent lactate racemase